MHGTPAGAEARAGRGKPTALSTASDLTVNMGWASTSTGGAMLYFMQVRQVEEYRRQAAECAALARNARDQTQREQMLSPP
jgi:hypothetical protein